MGKLSFVEDPVSIDSLVAADYDGSPGVITAEFDPQGNSLTTTLSPPPDYHGRPSEYITGISALAFWLLLMGCLVYFFKSFLVRCTRWTEKKLCCGGRCSDGTCCAICCFGADLENTENMVDFDDEPLDDIWSTRLAPPPPYEEARDMPRPETSHQYTSEDDDSGESGFGEPPDLDPSGIVNVAMEYDDLTDDSQSTNTTDADEESDRNLSDDEEHNDVSDAQDPQQEAVDADDEDEAETEEEEESTEPDPEVVATLQEQLRNASADLHTIAEEPHPGTSYTDFSYPPSPMRMSRAPSLISLGRDFTYPNTPYPSFPPTPNMLSRNPSLLSINDLPDTVSFRSIDSQLPTYRSAVNILMKDDRTS